MSTLKSTLDKTLRFCDDELLKRTDFRANLCNALTDVATSKTSKLREKRMEGRFPAEWDIMLFVKAKKDVIVANGFELNC